MVATREFSVTYNGLTIPGTFAGLLMQIHGVHRVRKSSTEFDVSFEVMLWAPSAAITAANFRAACEEIESKLQAPLGDLTISLSTVGVGGSAGNILELRSSRREALNATAEVEKVGTQAADSARSRLYLVTVSGELPYVASSALTIAGGAGLREAQVIVDYSSSRRAQLTISGEYTGQSGISGGTSATAQYNAQFPAIYSALTAELGGTWPAVTKPFSQRDSRDKTNDVMAFERVYKEIVANESIGAPDDADVIDQRLSIERVTVEHATDPFGLVDAPQELRVIYEADIDKNSTTNLRQKWEGTLRAFVLNRIRTITNSGTITLDKETLSLDLPENVIRADLTLHGWTNQTFISLDVTTTVTVRTGQEIDDVWPEKDSGNLSELTPTKAYRFGSAKEIIQVVTTTRSTLGERKPINPLKGTGIISATPVLARSGKRTAVLLSKSGSARPTVRGVRGIGDRQIVTEESITEEIRIIEEIT